MKFHRLAGATLLATLLSACVVAPAPRAYYREPVIVAPPPPRVEYVGPPPVVGQVWIEGFWNWSGGRHDWVPGHWENPRPGYAWVPHRWDRDGERWRLQGGHWETRPDYHDRGRHEGHERERRDWR